eukprot:7379858-Prymnesium_polylepis.1
MGFCKALKALCVEEGGRKINCAANVVPRGDKQAAKIGIYEVLRRYLSDPTKDKTIDKDGVQFNPRPVPCPPPRPPPGHPQRFYWDLTWIHLPHLLTEIARGNREDKTANTQDISGSRVPPTGTVTGTTTHSSVDLDEPRLEAQKHKRQRRQ